MNDKDIIKFNQYCAGVMGYDKPNPAEKNSYDPYYNLYQLAAVVEELINLEGKNPADHLGLTTTSIWRIWSNFVINSMLNEGLGTLESKLMLELATYEDGMVSKYDFIKQSIKVIKSHEEKVVSDEVWDSFVEQHLAHEDAKLCEAILKEKITEVLVASGYSFATSSYPDNGRACDILEKDNVDPFYGGTDETLELWAWRQASALEDYFEQRPELWELWNNYKHGHVYNIGVSMDGWRQDRIKWCIEQLDEII